jgi:hypothetical protein
MRHDPKWQFLLFFIRGTGLRGVYAPPFQPIPRDMFPSKISVGIQYSHYGYSGAPLKTPSVTCSAFLRFQVRPSISRNTLTCSGVEARL